MELCNVDDYCFSAQVNHATLIRTIHAFEKAIGTVNLQIKYSFFPNTYLKYLANFPLTLSRKVGLSPSKALALVLYVLYIGIGYVDTATAVYKIIEIIT